MTGMGTVCCEGSINRTQWLVTGAGIASFTVLLGLESSSALIFTLLREAQQRTSVDIPVGPGHFC